MRGLKLENPYNQDEGRQLHLVKDSLILHKHSRSQEKLNLDMRVVFAKNYVDNLSEEVKKGQKAKIENGWCPQGNAPLGYKSERMDGKSIHVVDRDTSHYIVKMFELFQTGEYSVNKLSDKMYEIGLRSKNGNKVKGNDIHRHLTKVFYTGCFKWNGHVYQGNHEPLVSESLFQDVQKLLKRKRPPKYRKHDFLFKSMIACKECESSITWETHKGINYGHCTHYKPCTQKTWVKDGNVEEQVKHALKLLQIKNERLRAWIYRGLCEKHKLDEQFNTKLVENLKQSISKLKNRMNTLIDMRADGEVTKEKYLEKQQEAKKELNVLEEKLLKFTKGDDKQKELKLKIFQTSQDAKKKYTKLSPEKKRSLLNDIYETITLDEGHLEHTHTERYSLLQKAITITNRSKLYKLEELPNTIFEPEEKFIQKLQSTHLYDDYLTVRRGWDSIGTFIFQYYSVK